MSLDPYLSEIELFAFPFAPKGFAQCNGQTMPISQNQALFSLLGTTYGGDGVSTFALPDLRGRVPLHWGNGPGQPAYTLGQKAGEQSHVLTQAEIPAHVHSLSANASEPAAKNGNTPSPGDSLGQSIGHPDEGDDFAVNIYNSSLSDPTTLAGAMIGNNGFNQGHENRQPFTVLNYCIALAGTFPSRG